MTLYFLEHFITYGPLVAMGDQQEIHFPITQLFPADGSSITVRTLS